MTRIGDWMQTFTGRQFWPLDPRPEDIVIEDIAHALSLQCRYGGHVRTFYSVAEHSWRVSKVCNEEDALWGLMHDAAEAYLVDLPRPIKRYSALGDEYRRIESRLMSVICDRFSLSRVEPLDVKRSDDFMLHWEGRDLMGPHPVPWVREGDFSLPEGCLIPMSPRVAEAAFLERFAELISVTGLEKSWRHSGYAAGR